MKTALAITLSAGVGLFATLALLSQGHLLQILAFGLALVLAGAVWKSGGPWWLPTFMFALMGVSHLLASWWLRSQGHPTSNALDTFGPGYLLIAALYFVRRRGFGGAQSDRS